MALYNNATVVRDDLNTTIHVEANATDAADALKQVYELCNEEQDIRVDLTIREDPPTFAESKRLAEIQEERFLLDAWTDITGPNES